ncbi:MAG: hypothetical protein ACLFS3_02720 [Candidatus Aenigmatarchaeota archaeon]
MEVKEGIEISRKELKERDYRLLRPHGFSDIYSNGEEKILYENGTVKEVISREENFE